MYSCLPVFTFPGCYLVIPNIHFPFSLSLSTLSFFALPLPSLALQRPSSLLSDSPPWEILVAPSQWGKGRKKGKEKKGKKGKKVVWTVCGYSGRSEVDNTNQPTRRSGLADSHDLHSLHFIEVRLGRWLTEWPSSFVRSFELLPT